MLRMSKLTDYGVILMACLAHDSERTQRTAHELAEISHVPLPTVSKIFKGLSKAGLAIAHRGRKGGYSLARPAEEISVAEIIAALEGPIGITECSDPVGTCDLEKVCLARGSWDPVSHAIRSALEKLPLSTLSQRRSFVRLRRPSSVSIGGVVP